MNISTLVNFIYFNYPETEWIKKVSYNWRRQNKNGMFELSGFEITEGICIHLLWKVK